MRDDTLLRQAIVWIERHTDLVDLCALWQHKNMLAIDTEFIRTRTYYPIAGLVQVNDGEQNYLIDPRVIDDFTPLKRLLEDTHIVKALHSCSEDLDVLFHLTGCVPSNVLDTQIAAAVMGDGFSMGFANTVKALFDIDLPKGETRSDWLQRPLSTSQMHYAALDVEYLYQLAEHYIQSLTRSDRLAWVNEEYQRLTQQFFLNQDPQNSHLRFKSAWRLSPVELAILQALSSWREQQAQTRDLPRNHVVKDAHLFALSLRKPSSVNELCQVEGLSQSVIRRYGRELLQLIENLRKRDEHDLPAPIQRPLKSGDNPTLALVKSLVESTAVRMGIRRELLLKKKDYENILRSANQDGVYQWPENLRGWRDDIIGNELISQLNKLPSNTKSSQ